VKTCKHLWYVEGLNVFRHRIGEYFWAVSSLEARMAWAEKFGGIPTTWRFEKATWRFDK